MHEMREHLRAMSDDMDEMSEDLDAASEDLDAVRVPDQERARVRGGR